MTPEKFKVFIVDDDKSIRQGFSLLLMSAGYEVETYSGGDEFLSTEYADGAGCILLDVFLEGRSGLDMQEEIKRKFAHLPIIYITGQGSIPMSVQAFRKGAVNFLQKPVDDLQLLAAVEEAINESRTKVSQIAETDRIQGLIKKLTPREFDVFRLLITGLLNKQIAGKLNIAEQTVKIHRGKITEKLGVKSVAEIVHLAEKAGLL
ncbi:MAG: response regulator transcription factor [Bacteroidales bacterium]|nr:response regulator transcription factor [Bacteroidales bacterium]